MSKPALRRLASHGRFPYRPITAAPSFAWPGGCRLAVYIGLNVEVFDFGKGKGAELAPMANQPDVLNWSWREYGNRVGAWRLLKLLEEVGWGPVGAIINTACYEECPNLMDALRQRGDEFIAHGHTNSDAQGSMDVEEERALIAACTARIQEKEGVAPKGWLSPWISESLHTPDLLQDAGYTYNLNWAMDDLPVRMSTNGGTGSLLALPYPQEVNDIPSVVGRKDGAAEFADIIIDSFDEQKRQAEDGPLVFGIALHPYLVGQPHRLKHLRRALQHIVANREGVWITTPGQIAKYVEDKIE